MKKKKSISSKSKLRQKAEELICKNLSAIEEIPSADIKKLLNELQIHQVELELQNDKLRQARFELETAGDKISDLFDFAGFGYITIDGHSIIREANLTATSLLAIKRKNLTGKPITSFICKDDQDVFYFHRKKLVKAGSKHSCELRMLKHNGEFFWANLDSVLVKDSDEVLTYRIYISDITERKQAETALRKNQERYQKAQALGHVGNWEYDLRTTKFWGSDEAKRICGFDLSANDFNMESVEKCIPERERVHQALIDLIEHDSKYDLVFDIITHDKGVQKTIHSIAEVEKDSQGTPSKVTGIITDITERKQAEEAARQNEKRYKELVEKSGIAILIDDREGNFTYFNETFTKLFGYSAKELKEKSISLLVHSDDKDRVMQFHKNRLQGKKAPSRYEFRGVRKDGSAIYLEVDVTVQKEGEIYAGTRSYFWDITVRKQAEDNLRESEGRYRELFEKETDAIMIFDVKTLRFNDINPAALNLYGYTRDEFLALTVQDISAEPYETMKMINRIVSNGGVSLNLFVRNHKKKDGTIFPVEISPGIFSFGDQQNIIGAVRDITERTAAEEKLNQSYRQLRALSKRLNTIREEEKTSIAREIHDDLGQALTALKIDLSNLEDELSDTEINIKKKIKKIINLTDILLNKVRTLASELRPGILDDLGLSAAIEWQTDVYRERTDIKYKIKIEPAEIILDEGVTIALYRIFQELMTNIVRHAKAKHVHLNLTKRIDEVELQVHDDGIGITVRNLKSTKSLGLIGVRERVINVDGSIDFISKKNQGTKVIVKIPLNK